MTRKGNPIGDGTGLENRRGPKALGGSTPSPSALMCQDGVCSRDGMILFVVSTNDGWQSKTGYCCNCVELVLRVFSDLEPKAHPVARGRCVWCGSNSMDDYRNRGEVAEPGIAPGC